MRGADDGGAGGAGDLGQERAERKRVGAVEPGRWLVGDDHTGLHGDRAGEGGPLALTRGELADRAIGELPDLLNPGDVLVLNDTRVIPSRLHGLRVRDENAARIEIMLHKRDSADRWRAFARPAKKLVVGDRIRFGDAAESTACELVRLDAEVVEKGEG